MEHTSIIVGGDISVNCVNIDLGKSKQFNVISLEDARRHRLFRQKEKETKRAISREEANERLKLAQLNEEQRRISQSIEILQESMMDLGGD